MGVWPVACGREFVCRFEIEESIISYIPMSNCRNGGSVLCPCSLFSVYTKSDANIKHNIKYQHQHYSYPVLCKFSIIWETKCTWINCFCIWTFKKDRIIKKTIDHDSMIFLNRFKDMQWIGLYVPSHMRLIVYISSLCIVNTLTRVNLWFNLLQCSHLVEFSQLYFSVLHL